METDPFFWSIDEVVAYLCHGSFKDWARSSLPRPDPVQLESHLRENYVTGEVLLTEVDREALPRYLGLKALGHQATIFKAIQYLRSRSFEFHNSTNDFSSPQNVIAASPAPIHGSSGPPVCQNRSITFTHSSREPQAPPTKSDTPQPVESTPKGPDLLPPQHKENDGRKRRRLNSSAISTQTLHSIPENPRQKRYLCSQKQPVKDVFYKGLESDEDNDTFGYVRPSNFSTGQSRFINKRMQYFLRQMPQPFPEDKEGSLAIFPYDKTVAPGVPRYFTLYEKNDGKINVRMEEVGKWPHLKEKSALDYLLVKYPPQGEELPPYGDSGSEDYDSDTCRDMDEARDDAEDENKDDTSNLMSAAELNAIIEKFIMGTVEKWKSNKLPMHEKKAWALWQRSRKAGTVPTDIRRAKAEIAHLDGRLANWSKGIKSNEYEKGDHSKVLRQCASLEVTVAQRELRKWQLSVLELGKCPDKPSTPFSHQQVPRQRFKDNDEESIGSDTDDAMEDDPDFVVSDEAHGSHVEGICPQDNTTITPPRPSMPSRESACSPPGPTGSTPINGPFEDVELVDLTQVDQEDQQEVVEEDVEDPDKLDIHTPPLNPADSPKDRLQFPASSLLPNPMRDQTPSATSELPDFNDVAGMAEVNWNTLTERRDRKRLLAKTVYTLSEEERSKLTSLLSSMEKNAWRRRVREALKAIQKNRPGRIASASEDDSFCYRRMATLYVSWLRIEQIQGSKGIRKSHIKESREKDDLFPFYNDLTEILCVEHPKRAKREPSCEIVNSLQKTSQEGSAQANNPIIIEDEEDDPSGKDADTQGSTRATPRKKRKRPVAESREAMETQNRAQRRVEEQASQQRRLQEEGGIENDDPERKIVSFDDPVIYLHRDLGRRVKEHQISGIQFMWRELIKDEKNEGCLLAHTMGLGKTMQVISLLVTIANASNSSDPKIKLQVPERLRTSRTLITCPASLIDNWEEEFAKWTPPDTKTRYNLGEVRKVVSLNPLQRLVTINAWYTEGGVLLISHELLRRMIHNPTQRPDSQRLPLEKCEIIKCQLLDGPNIIVADEAHKLKNGASNLSKACAMFKSKSRIALTGSPLSNQLIDYYQMINWISPGYLGTLKQFKAKYEEPIREGLYYDSTNWEYVQSRKKLEVLKKVLEPKVNRAGVSVIQKDLPSKVEFVIVIPVTPLQEETYNQFVALTMEGKGDFEFTRLWALLSYLTLLCHHPSCFLRKLLEKKKEKSEVNERWKAIEGSQVVVVPSESEPEANPEDSPTLAEVEDAAIATEEQATITDELVSQFEQKLKSIKNLDSPEHSRRTQMVGQIVDESIKAGDKVLIFSGYLYTLTYIGTMLAAKGQKFCRLDGKTPIATRQAATKSFSNSDSQVYLISTKAGALGLNIIGANRVIIFESEYNPTWEEQAIGRAYRLGQTKDVFVYRFVMGGTFEELIHEKGVFKKNMALRAVDKKNPTRSTGKSTSEFRRPIRSVKKHDLSEFRGKDPKVLDKILAQPNDIYKIILTETLHREDAVQFTAEEKNEIQAELDDERLERSDPVLWAKKQHEKRLAQEESVRRALALSRQQYPQPFPAIRAGNGHQPQPGQSPSPIQWQRPYTYNGNGAVNAQPVPTMRTPVSSPLQSSASSHISNLAQPLPLPSTSYQGLARTALPTQTTPSQSAPIQTSSPIPVPPASIQMQPSIVPSPVPPAPHPNSEQQGPEARSVQPPPLPPSTAQPLQDPKTNSPKQIERGMRGK
ncbi:hypothetical protein MaudMau93_005070 [Microsporum audouinii]